MRQANTVHHYRIPAVLALITVAVMLAFAAAMTVSAQSNDPDWRQAPTGLSVTAGNEAGELDINWDTSSQDTKTLSDYRVTWKPDGEAFKNWGETDWNAFPSTNELTLTGLNAGATYQVKVRARYDDNKKSRWSAVVTAQSGVTPNTAATGQPVINGTAQVRQTLTAGTSSIADDNGLTNTTFSHQWLRNADDTNTDVSGATDETYVLSNADLAHSIKVRVSFTDDDGYTETVTSKATAVVVVPPNVAPTGLPTITGTAEEGETLNADTSDIVDDNGLTNVAFSHQWVRSADETHTDIADATGSTYIVTSADAGSTISVRASFTDDDGYAETLSSKTTAQVTGTRDGEKTLRFSHETQVPQNWSLEPAGLNAGDEFRLIFFSSTKRDASSTEIADYNTFVQGLAAAGHADIRAYSSGFRVVGCTRAVDARDNTGTTGAGVPIYWLNGNKVADDYADFYDGSWDDEAHNKNESGAAARSATSILNYPFTGCDHDGTKSNALGGTNVIVGRPNSSASGDGPLSNSITNVANDSTRPMYGLSEVLQVSVPDLGTLSNGRTNRSGRLTSTDPVSYYKFTLTTQKDVQISVLNQETEEAVLQLVDSDDYTQKEANSFGAGTDRIMWTILGAGTHYIKISQTTAVHNTFDLKVQVRNSPLVNDDFGGDIWTDGTIILGGSVNGTIRDSSQRHDNDWFKLENLTTGIYDIRVKPRGSNTASGLIVIIRDQNGQFLELAYLGKKTYRFIASGDPATAGTPQTLYLEVRGHNGDYTLSVKRKNYAEQADSDLPNDATTAGWMEVGYDPNRSRSGETTVSDDQDAFFVDLVAGKSYRIDVKGDERTDYGGTTSNPLVELRDSTGAVITDGTNVYPLNTTIKATTGITDDNRGAGNNARLDIQVKTTDSYLISVGGSGTYGTYTLTVNELTYPVHGSRQTVSEPLATDFPNNSTTTGFVQVNGTGAQGVLHNANDYDAFKIQLRRGKSYLIQVRGDNDDAYGGTLADPDINLRHESRALITDTNVITLVNTHQQRPQSETGIYNFQGNRKISFLLIDVHVTGTYLILVSRFDSLGGSATYTVYATEAVTRDTTTPRGSKRSVPERNQDLPNFITSDGYVQVNGNDNRANGNIDSGDDQDVFAVQLKARRAYQIEVWGEDATENGGTLTDPKVRLRNRYFDNLTNAAFVEQTNTSTAKQSLYGISDANGGSGQNSLIPVAVYQDGTYYIQVGSKGTETGTYTVYVNEIGWHDRVRPGYTRPGLPPGSSYATTSSEPDYEDLTQNTATTGNVEPIGTRAHGSISTNGDIDYFKIVLVEDYSYRIEVKGDEDAAFGGNLSDPWVELRDSRGNPIGVSSNKVSVNVGDSSDSTRIADDDSGEGANATLEIWARQTGTYYIKVSGYINVTGTYTVQATVLHRGGFTN